MVDSWEMTLSLPEEKLPKVQYHCQEILEKGKVTVRELSKLIGRLSSTAIAVFPTTLQHPNLQHPQMQKLICHNSFEEKVEILVETKKELLCWKENLTLCDGRSLGRSLDSSKWKLNPTIFMKLCQIRETPEMNLFAFRVSQQLPKYISWKIDPFNQGPA